jgi:hypothetical protein
MTDFAQIKRLYGPDTVACALIGFALPSLEKILQSHALVDLHQTGKIFTGSGVPGFPYPRIMETGPEYGVVPDDGIVMRIPDP